MTKPEPSPQSDYSELRQENAELRARLERFETQLERERAAVRRVGWFGLRLFVGRDLHSAFRDWLQAKSIRDPLPVDQTATLAAALVRRLMRVSFVGLLVAALPIGLLIWQNLLFREQISQQVSDSTIVRRAQLLATIYDCAEPEPEPPSVPSMLLRGEPMPEICTPKAHSRARAEAVRAFAELERSRGKGPNLSWGGLSGLQLREADLSLADLSLTDLSRADLFEADLSRANLRGADLSFASLSFASLRLASLRLADLSHAQLYDADLRDADLGLADLGDVDLREADLGDADLGGANLSGADLGFADLSGADVGETNLCGADLSFADISGVDLSGADLSNAYLSAAHGLTQAQVDSAYGDVHTKLPSNLTRPDHWVEPDAESDPEPP